MITRKTCEPLEEDSFRPILHHYDGPKFRLELNVPEVFNLCNLLLNIVELIPFECSSGLFVSLVN